MRKFIFTIGTKLFVDTSFDRKNEYELFFHHRHGLVTDASELLTKKEVDYIEDTVNKMNIQLHRAIFVEAEDGSVSLAVAYPHLLYNNSTTYPGRRLRTTLEGNYQVTVSTFWRVFAYFQIDAPFRYGDKTKAFHNLRNYLSDLEKFVRIQYQRVHQQCISAAQPAFVPRLFEREILYKTKDLRLWLDYIGLCQLEDLDEPITEVNEEILKQLTPYIKKYISEQNIGYKTSSAKQSAKHSKALALGECLFNIKSGELFLEKVNFVEADSKYYLFRKSKRHNSIIQAVFLEFLDKNDIPRPNEDIDEYLSTSRYFHSLNDAVQLFRDADNRSVSHNKYEAMLSDVELTARPTTNSLAAYIESHFSFFRIVKIEYITPNRHTEFGVAIVYKHKEGHSYGLKVFLPQKNQSFRNDEDTIETMIVQFIIALYREGKEVENETYIDLIGRNLNNDIKNDRNFYQMESWEDWQDYLYWLLKFEGGRAYYSENGNQ